MKKKEGRRQHNERGKNRIGTGRMGIGRERTWWKGGRRARNKTESRSVKAKGKKWEGEYVDNEKGKNRTDTRRVREKKSAKKNVERRQRGR